VDDLVKRGEENRLDKGFSIVAYTLAVLLGLFQIYTALFGVLPAVYQRAAHWGIIGNFIFLLPLCKPEGRRFPGVLINIMGILCTTVATVYIYQNYDLIITRLGAPVPADIYLGIILTVAVLAAAYQTLGWPLPTLSLLFLLYAFAGPYLPGLLGHRGYNLERLSSFLYLGTEGIFGPAMNVAATYIFLFILLGVFLEHSGAGQFFVDLAFAVSGRIAGGPAQAAVVSSALMGTISGSGVANVVTTGTFTIPLMKKTGFRPDFAAAVEAVASNGGQIMPPVMGAVAFLMAEMIGVKYIEIAKAALLPAILYFVSVAIAVYLEAKRMNMRPMQAEEMPKLATVFKEGFYYLLPLIVLIHILVKGDSAMKAGIYAFFITIAISFFRKETRFTPRDFGDAFYKTAKTARSISAACACAGIIIGIVTLTGLGVKMSRLIVELSMGRVFLALPLTMLVSLVMGMGLPTTAAYLVLAVLGAPALVNMGVDVLPAHLFILYFGALSTITPPVALSTYAAAGIAGSDPIQTGITAVKLAAVSFIIPFMFVFSPELLLMGTPGATIFAVVTALIGCLALAASIVGWLGRKIGGFTRFLFFASALALLQPGLYTDIAGLGLLVVATVLSKIGVSRTQKAGVDS
jgi:TRAP transporter 4TM/12TM fusion protein